jgi:hypothetical protein
MLCLTESEKDKSDGRTQPPRAADSRRPGGTAPHDLAPAAGRGHGVILHLHGPPAVRLNKKVSAEAPFLPAGQPNFVFMTAY